MKRYPLAGLVDAVGLSEAATARMVGLSGSTLKQAREHGFQEKAADRYAVRAGLVPWLIWSDWLDDCEIPCPECETRFVPSRKSHRFCTRGCYQRRYKRDLYRERYASDPEFRAAQREKSATYRESTRAAAKIKNAAYYRANRERILAAKTARYASDPEFRERILEQQRTRDRAKAAA
jgi:hypothetical protein